MRVLNQDGEWVEPDDPSVTGRADREARTRRRALFIIFVLPLLIALVWVSYCGLVYVPSNQATCDRVRVGMSVAEVQEAFGRQPGLDTDKNRDIVGKFMDGKRNLAWFGPEGAVFVNFDRAGCVERASCVEKDDRITPISWLQSRLGLWP